jgi:type IV secretory pathway TraG/TraD family ATPase VirD4
MAFAGRGGFPSQWSTTKENHAMILWGNANLPRSVDEKGFLIAGGIGSAKSKMLALLLSNLASMLQEKTHRILAYDPKNELMSIIYGIQPPVPIYSLNPADVRSAALDFADVDSAAAAVETASILLPHDKNDHNPFFADAARDLVSSTMLDLVLQVPGAFDLRDVILISAEQGFLRQISERTPYVRHLRKYFQPEGTYQSIQATLASKFQELRILAAWQARSRKRVSLRSWALHQNSILFLGMDATIQKTLTAFNRLVMKQLTNAVLSGPDNNPNRTYFALEEFPSLGGEEPVPGWSDLVLRGRGPGARQIAVIQSVGDMRRIYGKELAEALLGQLGNKLLLRTDDPDHARWCSEVVGRSKTERNEWTVTSGESSTPRETTTNSSESVRRHRETDDVVPPHEFQTLPPATPKNGIHGFALCPYVDGVWRFHYPGSWVNKHIPRPHPYVPGFVPRPAEHQLLAPFTADDLSRLKLRPLGWS